MNEDRKLKVIYYQIEAIREGMNYGYDTVDSKLVEQYNSLINDLDGQIDIDLKKYLLGQDEIYNDSYDLTSCVVQVDIVLSLLKNVYLNDNDKNITKIGNLYTSIEDDELRDRCSDLLSSDGPYDRVINQATQVLEDRIKNKAELGDTNLIGFQLVAKAIHSKLEETILKFSDKPEVQEGYSNLFKGIMLIYRNPTHHSFKFKCSREYSLKFCVYIDELLRIVEKSIKVK